MGLNGAAAFYLEYKFFKSVGRKRGVCHLVMVDHRLNEMYGTDAFTYRIFNFGSWRGCDRLGLVKWLTLQLERYFFV
jgi:hypothetical protein